jgi:hypothetical protein
MLRSRMRSARQLLQPFEASGRTQNADVVRVSRLLALTAAQSHEEFSSDVIRRSSEFCERKAVIRRRISIGSSGSFVSSFFKTKLVLSTVKRADVSGMMTRRLRHESALDGAMSGAANLTGQNVVAIELTN